MTSYVVLESNSSKLDVRTLGLDRLRLLAETAMEIRWNREGEVRRVPLSVIQNIYVSYEDAMKLVNADRLAEASAASHLIHWEQAEPLDSTEMKVALDPRP